MALRNVIQRRNHKERSQPAARRKLGLLEKHKDYVERAKDHHVKQERIKRLQQKAALRNPDEFNFGMISGASVGGNAIKTRGKHVERRTTDDAKPLPNDLVVLLKSQDVGYIRTAIRAEDKKIAQLKQQIMPALSLLPTRWIDERPGRREVLQQHGLIDAKAQGADGSQSIAFAGKKTVWVDSVEEARSYSTASKGKGKAKESNADEYVYTLDDDSFMSDDDEEPGQRQETDGNTARSEKAIGRLVNELARRQERLDALHEARSKLETVRQLMTTRGTSARKVASNEEKLRNAMALGGKVTGKGLTLPGPDEEDSEDEKPKRTVWKWGRERKR